MQTFSQNIGPAVRIVRADKTMTILTNIFYIRLPNRSFCYWRYCTFSDSYSNFFSHIIQCLYVMGAACAQW